jgi:sugar lactone lactonase YvrE
MRAHRPLRRAALQRAAALAAILAAARPVAAQPDVAPAESAAVARAAYGRATRALRAGDLAVARSESDHAAAAWPTQPAYLFARAYTAARASDTAAVLQALGAVAAIGLGRDLSDSAFAPYRTLPAFAAVAARLDTNRAPLPRSRPQARLADSAFWPEGVDHDPRTGRFYVAGIRHRTIAELAPDGAVRELWPRGQPGLGALLGVRVDTALGVLWATTSGIPQMAGYAPGDSAIAALLRVRIVDGAIERRWDLPARPGGHVLGDLAVGPRGDVWITDSNEPVLYRLRPGADTLERVTSPLFRSLQGVAPTPDGRAVYLADYSHGLLRLEIATGRVTRLPDAPGSTALGVDGLAWHDGALVAVQNGVAPARVMRYVLDAAGARVVRAEVLDRNVAVADEPTIGTVADGDFVYVANSQWEKHDERGTPLAGRPLTPPVLLAVPLDRRAPAGRARR